MHETLHHSDTLPLPDPGEAAVEFARDELALDFSMELERSGFASHVLEGPDNPLPDYLQSLTLVEHADRQSDEPMVRLYRGVRASSGHELAHQVCYLLKKPVYQERSLGVVTHAELESPEAFQAVKVFTENPSYRALKGAIAAAAMTEGDQRFVAGRVKSIQLELLRDPNTTLMNELQFNHVAAPAGVATQDISPFIATSSSPNKAAVHGDTLMVLDVPVSVVAGAGEDDEVLLAGEIDPAWITVAAHFKERPSSLDDPAVQAVLDVVGADSSGGTEHITRESSAMSQASRQSREQDILDINKDLVEDLLAGTPQDADDLRQLLEESGAATYKDALWVCAEYYHGKRAELMGRKPLPVHELYDRDEVDPPVLTDIGEHRPRVLDADSIHRLAQHYQWQKSRHQPTAA